MNGRLRLFLLALCSLLGIVGGYLLFDTPRIWLLYEKWGFAGIALSFLVWALAMWGLRPRSREELMVFFRGNWLALALALLLLLLSFQVAPPKMRIYYDESTLAGIAFAMHQEHGNWVPRGGYFRADNYENLVKGFDKRPLTFPFLAYMAHSLTGYRLANGYAVNFLAGAACLFLLFVLVRRWTTSALGYAGMVLLAACPLFVLWSSSWGFEIVNLAFLLASVLLVDELGRKRDAPTAAALVATLVLLAQCRYESALFLLAGLPVAALLLRRDQWPRLPLWLGLAPLALVPLAWQQQLFTDPQFHQLEHAGPLFSVDYFFQNLGRAWVALTGLDEAYMTLPAVLYLAAAGFLLHLREGLAEKRLQEPRILAVTLFVAISYLSITVLQFSYHMGDLTQPITARLGIVYLPLLALGTCLLFYRLQLHWHGAAAGAMLLSLCLLFWAWPVAGNHKELNEITTTRFHDRIYSFLERRDAGHETMVLAKRAQPFIVHGLAGLELERANEQRSWLLQMLAQRFFQEIYVAQIVHIETGAPMGGEALEPGFVLEPLYREQIQSEGLLRISRVRLPLQGDTPAE